MELLGNWDHWTVLREHQVLKRHFDAWRQEVEIKLRSQGVLASIELAKSTAPGAAGAAKWLAEGGFVEDKRLRTKEGREKEAAIKRAAVERAEEDAKRIGLE